MDKEKDKSEPELMSVVSYLYYYADMNQSAIADKLFLSRSTVCRLLKKARQSGVVELKINEPWTRELTLEDEIKTAFSIERVRVLATQKNEPLSSVLDKLGQIASFHISCNAQGHSVLGLSWGNTIAHVVDSVSSSRNIPFTVVPIMGTMSWPANPENLELCHRFSKIYGGRYFPLNAPLYADSEEHRQELMHRQENEEALELARKADFIFTSVGSIVSRSWENIIGPQKLARLCEIGCVGHIGGHFFNIEGREIDGDYKDLLVGLTLEEIRASHNVICVAATEKKAEAVYGALRGGMIDTLMITSPLAEKLLEIAGNRRL